MNRFSRSSQSQENRLRNLFDQICELLNQISFRITFSCNLLQIEYLHISICKVKILSHQFNIFLSKTSHILHVNLLINGALSVVLLEDLIFKALETVELRQDRRWTGNDLFVLLFFLLQNLIYYKGQFFAYSYPENLWNLFQKTSQVLLLLQYQVNVLSHLFFEQIILGDEQVQSVTFFFQARALFVQIQTSIFKSQIFAISSQQTRLKILCRCRFNCFNIFSMQLDLEAKIIRGIITSFQVKLSGRNMGGND